MNTKLEVKIRARNRVNALAVAPAPAMLEALTPFVGQPVQNVTGLLKAKVKSVLPECPDCAGKGAGESNRYTLRVRFKICERIARSGGYCDDVAYAEEVVTLGELSQAGVLTKVITGHVWRTDYTAAEIETVRAQIKEARQVLNLCEHNLAGFGEYDA